MSGAVHVLPFQQGDIYVHDCAFTFISNRRMADSVLYLYNETS